MEYNSNPPLYGVQTLGWEFQYIYITTLVKGKDLKIGEYFHNTEENSIYFKSANNIWEEELYFSKVIASTNYRLSLGLARHGEWCYYSKDKDNPIKFQRGEYFNAHKIMPTPSNDFAYRFCASDGKIKDVLVEYHDTVYIPTQNVEYQIKAPTASVKINNDNTININKLEDLMIQENEITEKEPSQGFIKIGDKTYKEAQVIMLSTEESKIHKVLNQLIICDKVCKASPQHEPQHIYIVSSEEIKGEDYVLPITDENFPFWKDYLSKPLRVEDIKFTDKGSLDNGKSKLIMLSGNMNKDIKGNYFYARGFAKIIASTDSSLEPNKTWTNLEKDSDIYFPRPSDDFIKKFCELNGEIKDVLVEYEEITSADKYTEMRKANEFKLKVAPNNTISAIKKEDYIQMIQRIGRCERNPSKEIKITDISNKEKLYTKQEVENLIELAWACCSVETYKEGDDIEADCKSWIETHLK